MDDLLNQLNKQISRVTERVLSPQEMDALKRDVQKTMRSAGRVAGDAIREFGQGFQAAQNRPPFESQNHQTQEKTYWTPPGSGGPQAGGPGANGGAPQWNTFTRPSPRPRPQPRPQPQPRSFQSFGKAQPQAKRKDGTAAAWLLTVFGIILGLSSLSFMVEQLSYLSYWNPVTMIVEIAVAVLPAAACATAAACGIHRIRYIGRYHKYKAQLKGVDYASIADMAEFFAIPQQKLLKDLKRMTSDGLFKGCYFDEEETCFILSKEVYDQYLAMKDNLKAQQIEAERRRKIAEENPEAAALEEMRSTGESYIRKIRELNDALPAQDISEKLDTLEQICSQIFRYVEKHPEKLSQIRRFMSYYLPTTLKLTESYRDLELRGISTQEADGVKKEILDTLDNINLAFQNLYKNLMQKDLMGLSADISALETMLAQEGLIDGELKMDTPENGRSFDL